jgi:hypothetical protein
VVADGVVGDHAPDGLLPEVAADRAGDVRGPVLLEGRRLELAVDDADPEVAVEIRGVEELVLVGDAEVAVDAAGRPDRVDAGGRVRIVGEREGVERVGLVLAEEVGVEAAGAPGIVAQRNLAVAVDAGLGAVAARRPEEEARRDKSTTETLV